MSEESQHLSFDIIETPVKILKQDYTLRELDGPSSIAYRNFLLENIEKDEEGNITAIHNHLEGEQLLVSLGLYQGDEKVPVETVQGWPTRIVRGLAEKLKAMGEMEGGTKNPTQGGESTNTETGLP